MRTLTVSDEQYQLIIFALLIYAQECEKDAGYLNNQNTEDRQFQQLSQQRVMDARNLSTTMTEGNNG